MHCINHNAGDKPLVVICNVDTKPQGIIPCLFSSDNLPAKRCTTEEKSVGYTVFLHLNEGRKECGVHCFSPGVGKTLFKPSR